MHVTSNLTGTRSDEVILGPHPSSVEQSGATKPCGLSLSDCKVVHTQEYALAEQRGPICITNASPTTTPGKCTTATLVALYSSLIT